LKYHNHLLHSCIEALDEIFFNDRHADKCIEFFLKKNKKWGSRDRRFFAETVYDCVRWWRLYWHLLKQNPHPSCSEILIPSLWRRGLPLPENSLITEKDLERNYQTDLSIGIKESVPDWLWELLQLELGKHASYYLAQLNNPNKMVIRVNTSKISREQLQQEFKKLDMACEPLLNCNTGLCFPERVNVFATPLFKLGYFEVQDGSSQQVADYLDIEPGMRIFDACAGAGGKSLHIADLLNNRGRILSLDIHDWKLKQLKIRARRNGYSNIETRVIESSKTIKRLRQSADRVLLDVPCSGLGVLRRNPDTKWKMSKESLEQLRELQQNLLTDYSKMLKENGILVYSTCSILPSENQNQVQKFLQNHPNFSLVKQRTIFPSIDGYDGFYMAQILKKTN
jgi:16S rRNA (cytosine967-C5)-methyltransferase